MTDKAFLPVRNDCHTCAENRPNPVNPVVGWEATVDNSRSKRTGRIDAGCRELLSVKVGITMKDLGKIGETDLL